MALPTATKDISIPYQHNGVRNYREEYAKYAGKPSEIHKRVLRNRARRAALAAGLVHKGDALDIDHRIPLSKGGSGSASNLRVRSSSANRSFERTSTGAIK